MKKIHFIADFFVGQVFGGGELVNEEIISGLKKLGYDVERITCDAVCPKCLKHEIIIGNFTMLNDDVAEYIQENCVYSIIEHDHKYVRERDVTSYKDYIVPPTKIINRNFYKGAKYVYCQSKLHCDVVSKNLGIKNIVNLSTSIWSDEHLDIIENNYKNKKNNKTMILGSSNPIKNTNLCISYCQKNNIDFDVVGPLPYKQLIEKMSTYESLLFLPGVLETFNRLIVEARMLNVNVMTDNKNGCTSEDWFSKLKGKELLDFIRASKQSVISNFIDTPKLYKNDLPLISIITSKFKGDKHITSFLENITSQSAFDSCELIIIDASPGNECKVIKKYQKKYKNIIYKKITKDPGIYGCWNEAIKISKGKYITNANLDDRRADTHIEHHVRFLENNKDIDLVYSEAFVTDTDFEDYYGNSSQGRVYPIKDFSNENMIKCLPGCMPVWRADIHSNNEFFNESYKSAGDWEMWLRAIRNGSKFSRLQGIYGMYYMNPKGLSTNLETQKQKFEEEVKVFNEYKDIFGEVVYNRHKPYFNLERISKK